MGEEAAVAVDGLEEVLGGDDGVVAAVFGDLGGEEALVVGVFGGDLVGADDEDALTAVLGLRLRARLFSARGSRGWF